MIAPLPSDDVALEAHLIHVKADEASFGCTVRALRAQRAGSGAVHVLEAPGLARLALGSIGPRVSLVAGTVGQRMLPTPENVCAGQSLHVDSEIWAVSVEYLPSEHSEHGAEPFTSLYVPAMHAAHCIPSGPVYPLLQVQLVSIELPSGEYVCVGHSLHVDSEIAASLYCTCPESTVSTALSRSRPCMSPRCTLRIVSHQARVSLVAGTVGQHRAAVG